MNACNISIVLKVSSSTIEKMFEITLQIHISYEHRYEIKKKKTRQKGLHKQLLSDVINALASVNCNCLRAELNG